MNDKQAKPKSRPDLKQPDNRRRSFICKGGLAFSAVLATAAGMAKAGTEGENLQQQVDQLSGQLGVLQDTNAIRELHMNYGRYLEQRDYEAIVALFTGDSEVQINGEVYAGKEYGIRRLYVESFGAGITGDNKGPVHSLMRTRLQPQEIIEIAPDRRTATARFHSFMLVQVADNVNTPFMELARLQGQGIGQWWETGIYENTYVNVNGQWKIKRLAYHPTGQADI